MKKYFIGPPFSCEVNIPVEQKFTVADINRLLKFPPSLSSTNLSYSTKEIDKWKDYFIQFPIYQTDFSIQKYTKLDSFFTCLIEWMVKPENIQNEAECLYPILKKNEFLFPFLQALYKNSVPNEQKQFLIKQVLVQVKNNVLTNCTFGLNFAVSLKWDGFIPHVIKYLSEDDCSSLKLVSKTFYTNVWKNWCQHTTLFEKKYSTFYVYGLVKWMLMNLNQECKKEILDWYPMRFVEYYCKMALNKKVDFLPMFYENAKNLVHHLPRMKMVCRIGEFQTCPSFNLPIWFLKIDSLFFSHLFNLSYSWYCLKNLNFQHVTHLEFIHIDPEGLYTFLHLNKPNGLEECLKSFSSLIHFQIIKKIEYLHKEEEFTSNYPKSELFSRLRKSRKIDISRSALKLFMCTVNKDSKDDPLISEKWDQEWEKQKSLVFYDQVWNRIKKMGICLNIVCDYT